MMKDEIRPPVLTGHPPEEGGKPAALYTFDIVALLSRSDLSPL